MASGQAAPLTRRYADWYEAHPHEELPPMESAPVPEQRWRAASIP